MKKTIFIVLLILTLSPLSSFGQENRQINKNLDNIAIQYAECAAYYELVFNAMKTSNESKIANAYHQLKNDAMFYSLLLANEGRSKDLAIEVTGSRIDIYIKKMKRETDNRNENISMLINKYHFECQELMPNPPPELIQVFKRKIVEEADKQSKSKDQP
jgi:hypothetical protein